MVNFDPAIVAPVTSLFWIGVEKSLTEFKWLTTQDPSLDNDQRYLSERYTNWREGLGDSVFALKSDRNHGKVNKVKNGGKVDHAK